MDRSGFDPAQITGPIQLSAAWFATLLVLEGTLLAAAAKIGHPTWAAGVLVSAAIALPILVGVAVFLLQTRFRGEQLADPFYAEFVRRKEQQFRGFAPDVVSEPGLDSPPATTEAEGPPSESATEYWSYRPTREEIYERHHGLFIIHTWRPSTVRGQVADIVVRLFKHPDDDLPRGLISRVEYDLGPHWPTRPIVRTNEDQQFRLDVSAYHSALCVATVHFTGGSEPLVLYRYLDFS